jgi:type III pantothenate kinase
MTSDQSTLIAIAVGNTRTRFGIFHGDDLTSPQSLPSEGAAAIAEAVASLGADHHGCLVVVSSVNQPASEKIVASLRDAGVDNVLRIGEDLPVPMNHTLDDASTLGQDRILCAFGAWRKARQACVVVDAGTAITVDFIDGEGTFQGGMIAPGVAMMLKAMHDGTAALPLLAFTPPDEARGPFGKETTHAMLLGVKTAAVGLVHKAIDTYALAYEAYPQVIATGGDAPTLFADDDLIEHLVPDLQLVGILETCKAHDEAAAAEADDEV